MAVSRLVVASLLLSVAPASASVATDLATIDKQRKACLDKDASTAGMSECNGHALDAADKLLNGVYKAAVDRLKKPGPDTRAEDKETLKRLVASERAWVAYKGAECALQGTSMLGGSGEGLAVGDCLYALTKARAKSLDDLFREK